MKMKLTLREKEQNTLEVNWKYRLQQHHLSHDSIAVADVVPN